MFVVKGEVLQNTVASLVKGARKARLVERAVFIKTVGSYVSFYFNGDDLQVEKKIEAQISGDVDIATSMAELDLKVSVLPSDEDITVEVDGSLLFLRWGRSNKIACETLAETSPLIEIPTTIENVTWEPGLLHGYARALPAFAAKSDSKEAKVLPCLAGLDFSMDEETGEVHVRVTTRYQAVTVRSDKAKWFEGIRLSVPTESILGLADILSADAEISIGLNEARTLLVFQAGLTTAVSRLLVGNFPDIDRIYSCEDTVKSTWTFDRMELIEVCRRARKLAPTRPVLFFKIEGSKVLAKLESVLNQQMGALCEGESFNFAVDANHMELAAALFRTEEIKVLFNKKDGPLTIQCEETDAIRALIGQIQV